MNTTCAYKAQNNFQTVARHSDWPKKFFLSQALILTSQKIEKSNSSLLNFLIMNVISSIMYLNKETKI